MDAVQLNHVMRHHAYASRSIAITPNPPRVGVATTIALYLTNPDAQPVTVTCIETMIAQFGMGVTWEQLPVVGPFELPADSNHIEEIKMEWTPQQGGHRCVRANIHIETLPQPLRVGRNLHVIESEAERAMWHVPFRVGNPEAERMPVALEVGGQNLDGMMARLIVGRRIVRPGEQIWLNAGEEVDAQLLLRARTPDAIESVHTVEAFINGRFLDGIQVEVRRPALATRPLHHHAARFSEPVDEVSVDETVMLAR